MPGSGRMRRVLSTWSRFVGGMGFVALYVVENLHGGRVEVNCGARDANVRPPQRQAQYSKVPANRFGHGSWRCGM